MERLVEMAALWERFPTTATNETQVEAQREVVAAALASFRRTRPSVSIP